jgi:hypothetical protein
LAVLVIVIVAVHPALIFARVARVSSTLRGVEPGATDAGFAAQAVVAVGRAAVRGFIAGGAIRQSGLAGVIVTIVAVAAVGIGVAIL